MKPKWQIFSFVLTNIVYLSKKKKTNENVGQGQWTEADLNVSWHFIVRKRLILSSLAYATSKKNIQLKQNSKYIYIYIVCVCVCVCVCVYCIVSHGN